MNQTNSHRPDSENVISDYYDDYQRLNLKSAEKEIQKSRDAIFVVAGITVIGGFLQMAIKQSFTTAEIFLTLIIAVIFTGLGFFAKKQPFGAIIVALTMYLGLWFLSVAFVGPEYLLKGIIVRCIIIFYLASGIPHAQKAEQIKNELKKR